MAIYYVSNANPVGNDGNNGLSTGAPWLTVNKVNTSAFNAGDSVLFNRGCTWRETLTVPSSGLADGTTVSGSGTSGKKLVHAKPSLPWHILAGDATYLYGNRQATGYWNKLRRFTSVDDIAGTQVHDFGAPYNNIDRIWTTSVAGEVFLTAYHSDTNKWYLFKSIDYGVNFGNNSPAFDDGDYVLILGDTDGTTANQITSVYLLGQGFAENTSTGDLYVAEYNINGSRVAGSTNDQVRFMKSSDRGSTWSEVCHWNTDGSNTNTRHMHSVNCDNGSVYLSAEIGLNGGMLMWDGTSAITSNVAWSTYSNCYTGYSYIPANMIFPSGDYAYYGIDSFVDESSRGIWKIKKDFSEAATHVSTAITDFDYHATWYGVIASDGTLVFTEMIGTSATDHQLNFYTSDDNGSTWSIFSRCQYDASHGNLPGLMTFGNYVLFPSPNFSNSYTLVLTTATATANEINTLGYVGTNLTSSAITFGYYGTGDDPIIDGSVLTSGYSLNQGWSTIWDATAQTGTSTWESSLASSSRNNRIVIAGAYVTANATQIRVKMRQNSANGIVYNNLYIGPQKAASDAFDFDAAPTQLLKGTAGNWTLGVGTGYEYTDSLTFSMATGTSYMVAFHIPSSPARVRLLPGTGTHLYFKNGTTESATADVTGYTASAELHNIAAIESYTGIENVYQTNLTTEPKYVWFDGVLGTNVATIALVNGARKWHWEGNVLYVYSTSDPATAYTSPGIEASQIGNLYMTDKSYVILEHLTFRRGGNAATESVAVNLRQSSNITLQDCSIEKPTGIGVNINNVDGTTGDTTIQRCSFSNTGDGGVSADANSAIQTHGTMANNPTILVQNCTFQNIDILGAHHGHGIYHNSGNLTWRYNHHLGDAMSNGAGAAVRLAGGTNNIYYNLITNEGTNGERAWGICGGGGTNYIYNNTFYGNLEAIYTEGGGTETYVVKNNIFCGVSGAFDNFINFAGAVTSYTGLNNQFYLDSGTPHWAWNNVDKTSAADWATASGEADYLTSDPLFVNAAGGDFTLQAGSPCINAGVDVGLTTDILGNPIVGDPDIGAYEKQAGGIGIFGRMPRCKFLIW